ncbi:hypothetical protein THAOC_00203 [Thalassiosira oceanica]|uniref:Clp1 N-terminal domain-containing protein n=1 Tax=Thalassiosira oceanica TaxID=159749 RepID=K0TGP8_THAOC|nr:hypothetical protein THAOC_00203 [Thalassiosira oceanica]|eukprot:EJK77928.1 hypothetical protein THAOC_00203 [Thalassiosira oceanica]
MPTNDSSTVGRSPSPTTKARTHPRTAQGSTARRPSRQVRAAGNDGSPFCHYRDSLSEPRGRQCSCLLGVEKSSALRPCISPAPRRVAATRDDQDDTDFSTRSRVTVRQSTFRKRRDNLTSLATLLVEVKLTSGQPPQAAGSRRTMIQGGINSESTFCELPNLVWATVSDSLCHLESTLSVHTKFGPKTRNQKNLGLLGRGCLVLSGCKPRNTPTATHTPLACGGDAGGVGMKAPTTHRLSPETELRLEVGRAICSVVLKDGSAELYGAEMAQNSSINLTATKVAIYTWHGCSRCPPPLRVSLSTLDTALTPLLR